jgi:putative transposase
VLEIETWSSRTGLPIRRLIGWLGVTPSKFYLWQSRRGQPRPPRVRVPRDGDLRPWEKAAILAFHQSHLLDGYRRLAYMMIDANVVAVSPSSVYRVLKDAGVLRSKSGKISLKGKGFVQPVAPHDHWHIDVSVIKVRRTYFYLCSILDGCSRLIVHWKLGSRMTETDVAILVEGGRERHPGVTPRIISDNGPQFIAKEFKEFVRLSNMTHVRTSPYYPQSNGKIERWHQTAKHEAIRTRTPLDEADAKRIIGEFVIEYNTVRLHSAIGYVTPADREAGRHDQIQAERTRKLAAAKMARRLDEATARAKMQDGRTGG